MAVLIVVLVVVLGFLALLFRMVLHTGENAAARLTGRRTPLRQPSGMPAPPFW
jgi:hypothetical protein